MLPEEEHAVGPHGPVNDAEIVARIVVSPRHFRSNGQLKPGVIPPSHFVKGGLSLIRVEKINEENYSIVARHIAEGTSITAAERQVPAGHIEWEACVVRSVRSSADEQSLVLLDDPILNHPCQPDNDAHALAKARMNIDELESQRIRDALFFELRKIFVRKSFDTK